ncbi:MAG: hypothetical protein AAFX09_11795 [Pseudomonadota bacterium]
MRIYAAFRAGQRGDGPRGVSDADREAFMGENLGRALTALGEGGAEPPRMIVFIGGHAARIAEASGAASLHIGVPRYQPDDVASPPDLFTATKAVLIDTNGVLNGSDEAAFAGLEPSLLPDLQGFDALTYLKEAPHASLKEAPHEPRSIMLRHKTSFRTTMLTALVMGLIVAALSLISLLPTVRAGARTALGRSAAAPALLRWAPMAALALVMGLTLSLQLTAIMEPGAAGAMTSASGLHGLLLVIGGRLATGLVILALMRGWFALGSRLLYAVCGLSVLTLALWMRYWNLGGMFA